MSNLQEEFTLEGYTSKGSVQVNQQTDTHTVQTTVTPGTLTVHPEQAPEYDEPDIIITEGNTINEEIAKITSKAYIGATQGSNEAERAHYMARKLMDESLVPQYNTYLTMTENDNKVKVIYGLTICPIDYQVDTAQILIAFFKKRRSEVSATLCMPVDDATDTILTKIPDYSDI